ncbi:hypothetical protein H0H81_012621 [Sphagnurus paluster]|uniref:Protein FRA10AC1 n=1 Tax=Sphagnurus paluster TaxID=117069 RepID=A0A9P7KHZ2_9AGAR|nr:hypothetical protein H0H81_012621 [Sphagnurus paluster]
MALNHYPTSSKALTRPGPTEFEILKASHKFLRDEDDEKAKELTWDEQLASKYYASLYREFAVCDLKHYKSGNFALRWRTEEEVLSGAGETTCANTRCEHHHATPEYLARSSGPAPRLTTLELPFAYEEHGENKAALVKVVLCPKCFDKLMWKRRKEKADKEKAEGIHQEPKGADDRHAKVQVEVKLEEQDVELLESTHRDERRRSKHWERGRRREEEHSRRRRSSRSRSPRAHHRRDRSEGRRDDPSAREREYRRRSL